MLEIPGKGHEGLLRFGLVAGLLKRQSRTGWVLKGVEGAESVADHSYRMALLGLVLAPRAGLNVSKVVFMALVHDLAEALVGDITPEDGISKEDKQSMEHESMSKICELLSGPEKEQMTSLFTEYEERKSNESKFVKDLDILDMVMNACEYESMHNSLDLSEFFTGSREKLTHPISLEYYDQIWTLRSTVRDESSVSHSIE